MPRTKARRAVARVRRVASNRVHRRRNRRRNPGTRIIVMPRHVRHNRRHKRNPQVFGTRLTAKNALVGVGGLLAGVAATKMIVPMLPSPFTGNTMLQALAGAGIAVGLGWLAGKANPDFGGMVMMGGLAEAASIGLNGILPIQQYTGLSGYRGMGVYAPSGQLLPNNPLANVPAGLLPSGANTTVYGNHGIYSRRAAA